MNQLDTIIDGLEKDLIKAVQENVSIKSVGGEPEEEAPFGAGPRKALDNFMDISKRLGFETGCFENMVGWAEYGNSNAPMVCILGHLDVVPEGDGWTYPPYGAEIHDGKMYGRGVVDDKGPVICALFALKAIRDAGISLNNRVRVLVGTNEETGSKAVKKYVESGQDLPVAGFTPDAHYPLINGEKGILICRGEAPFSPEGKIQVLSLKGGVADNVVPAHCEAVLKVAPELMEKVRYSVDNWEGPEKTSASYKENEDGTVTIFVEGLSGHGSTPHVGINSIAWMVRLLITLGVEGEQGKFLSAINRLVGTEYHGESLGICLYDDVSRYTSLCWGAIEAKEGTVSFTINPRYPVTFREEDVVPAMTKAFNDEGISLTIKQKGAPLFMSEDSELVQKLMKVYREKTGRDEKPLAIGGGTYAKAMPNILAFGPEMPGKSYNIHEADEGWEIEDMMETTKIMAAAIVELAK
jgi:succinyl-diaminopimelate desuccinylase